VDDLDTSVALRTVPGADKNLAQLDGTTGDLEDSGLNVADVARRAGTPSSGHVATVDSDGDPIDSGHALTEFLLTSDAPAIIGPVPITHDGGAAQAICTTPAFCDVMLVAVKCTQATDTSTINLGWSGDTDILITDDEFPKTLNAIVVVRFPTDPLTAAKDVIATVGGAGTVGEWDITIVYADLA